VLYYCSTECFFDGAQALGSVGAAVVSCAHGLVATVPWKLNLVIFHDVLL